MYLCRSCVGRTCGGAHWSPWSRPRPTAACLVGRARPRGPVPRTGHYSARRLQRLPGPRWHWFGL